MAVAELLYQIFVYLNGRRAQFALLTEIGALFMLCSMSQASAEDDGQLHTLGLLERLRSETNLVQGAYARIYQRVDKLLRELENPNLHDIRNMSFHVELWDQHALHIQWVVAAAGSVFLARAAFEEAVKQWPDQKLTLRQGIMLISELFFRMQFASACSKQAEKNARQLGNRLPYCN